MQTDNERILSTAQAINEACVMGERDKNAFFAEGVDDPSAVYGTTKGMVPIYGRDRVIEMPVAENGLCGVAIGAAMRGKRPVISFTGLNSRFSRWNKSSTMRLKCIMPAMVNTNPHLSSAS